MSRDDDERMRMIQEAVARWQAKGNVVKRGKAPLVSIQAPTKFPEADSSKPYYIPLPEKVVRPEVKEFHRAAPTERGVEDKKRHCKFQPGAAVRVPDFLRGETRVGEVSAVDPDGLEVRMVVCFPDGSASRAEERWTRGVLREVKR